MGCSDMEREKKVTIEREQSRPHGPIRGRPGTWKCLLKVPGRYFCWRPPGPAVIQLLSKQGVCWPRCAMWLLALALWCLCAWIPVARGQCPNAATPTTLRIGLLISGDSESQRVQNAVALAMTQAATVGSAFYPGADTITLVSTLFDGCADGTHQTTAWNSAGAMMALGVNVRVSGCQSTPV
jgi:hypothetical protein